MSFVPARGIAQVTNSPVGQNWAVAWTGADKGLTYLTFSNTSNDFVWTGYGISLKSFGPFTMAGTWGFNGKAQVVGGYTQTLPTNTVAGTVVITLPGGPKLAGTATSDGHHYRLMGEAGSVPVIAGGWLGEVHTHGTTFFESYTVSASTNMPLGWFDLAGTGAGPSGTFTVSGAWIVAPDHQANGYTIRDFGSSGNVTSSFSGKFDSHLTKVRFVGKDNDRRSVVIDVKPQ